MQKHVCAAAVILACGQSVALGQEESFDSPGCLVTGLVGCHPVLREFSGQYLNICPSVAITSGASDTDHMIFAWGSDSVDFRGGLNFAGVNLKASPLRFLVGTNDPDKDGKLPAQIYVRRYTNACVPYTTAFQNTLEPRGLVYYNQGDVWAHRYPSLGAQKAAPSGITGDPLPEGEPEVAVDVPGYSNVVATFGSDYSGFAQHAPAPDSRVIYVSSSAPSGGSGHWPTSPVNTVQAAIALLQGRDGYPDQILLKRGDVFNLTIPNTSSSAIFLGKSGRNEQEPFVIASYGIGDRPVLSLDWDSAGQGQQVILEAGGISYVRIQGITFTSDFGGLANGPTGFHLVGGGTDVRIEDCCFENLSEGVNLIGHDGDRTGNTVRRCIFWNLSGLVNDGGNGVLQEDHRQTFVEECFIGQSRPHALGQDGEWNTTDDRRSAHGLYHAGVSPTAEAASRQVIRDCIGYGLGLNAVTARAGGLLERNVAIRCGTGFSIGNKNEGNPPLPASTQARALLRQNLVIESINLHNEHGGFGFQFNPMHTITLEENIACMSSPQWTYQSNGGQGGGGQQHFAFYFQDYPEGSLQIAQLNMSRNIAYKWLNIRPPASPQPPGVAETDSALRFRGSPVHPVEIPELHIDLNGFIQHRDSALVDSFHYDLRNESAFFFGQSGGNRYWSPRTEASQTLPTHFWFASPADTNLLSYTFSGIPKAIWDSQAVEDNAVYWNTNKYATHPTSGDRTVGLYAQSIGLPDSTEAFIDKVRLRKTRDWDHRFSAGGLISYIRARFSGLPDEPDWPWAVTANEVPHRRGPTDKLTSNLYRVFSNADHPVPQVYDSVVPSSGASAASPGDERASVAYSTSTFVRVGNKDLLDSRDQTVGTQIWYTWSMTGARAVLATLTGSVRATTPCVSAANGNKFVAVWLEHSLSGPQGGTSVLKCARLTPGATPTVHQLPTAHVSSNPLAPLFVPPYGNLGSDLAWPRITHGATDWVVPASVACFNDGSFAVSYSHETGGLKHRYVQCYDAATPPNMVGPPMEMDTGGFYRFNHSLAAWGPSVASTTSRLVFVGMYSQLGQPWAPYFRTMMPGLSFKPGCWHKIPMSAPNDSNLSLGPTFAHPIAIRPSDKKLVVTWSRQTLSGSTPTGTVVGFSLMETAGTYAPADVDGNGAVDGADQMAFTNSYMTADPLADWNADQSINAADPVSFIQSFILGAQ